MIELAFYIKYDFVKPKLSECTFWCRWHPLFSNLTHFSRSWPSGRTTYVWYVELTSKRINLHKFISYFKHVFFNEISQNSCLDAFSGSSSQGDCVLKMNALPSFKTWGITHPVLVSHPRKLESFQVWHIFVTNRNHHVDELELTQATIIMKNTWGVHHRRK